jgi:hypothetical protein
MLRDLIWILIFAVCAAGLIAPFLIDAHHWWPRKPKKKEE